MEPRRRRGEPVFVCLCSCSECDSGAEGGNNAKHKCPKSRVGSLQVSDTSSEERAAQGECLRRGRCVAMMEEDTDD